MEATYLSSPDAGPEKLEYYEENLINILLENSNDYIFFKDRESRYIKVNENISLLLGEKSSEHVIGKSDFDYSPDIAKKIYEEEQEIMRTGNPQKNVQKEFELADGTKKWFSISKNPFYDKQGNVKGIVGIARDITDIKNIETDLRVREQTARAFMNSPVDAATLITKEGRIVDLNETTAKRFGKTVEEMKGNIIWDYFPLTVTEQRKQKVNEVFQTRKTIQFIDKRENFWNENVLTPIEIDGPEPDLILVISHDLREQKKLEEELNETEQRLYQLIHQMPYAVELCDPNGTARMVNQAFLNMFKIPSAELVVGKYNVFQDPLMGQLGINEQIRRVYDGEIVYIPYIELPLQLIDKKYGIKQKISVTQEVTMFPFFKKDGTLWQVATIWRDITARKNAESALKESEEKYRTLFEKSPNPIMIIDEFGNYLDCNAMALKLLECSQDELLTKNVRDYIPPGKELKVMGQHEPFWKQGGIVETEYYVNGKIKILELSINPMRLNGKNVLFGHGRDITEKKKAEKALIQSEEKYRTYIDNAPEGVFISDEEGNYIEVNKAATNITGYSEQELLSMNLYDITSKDNSKVSEEHFQRVKKQGFSSGEACFVHKDGSKRWWNVEAVKLMDNRYLGFTNDITDKKKAEMELNRLNDELEEKVKERTQEIELLLKHKDEFINQLGHDLKNPMGPLITLLPLLERTEKNPKQKEMLHVINRNVNYMKNLIAKTIQFAQLNSPSSRFKIAQINLYDDVEEILSINKLMFDNNQITVQNELSKAREVCADSFQLKEVFNNLLNNAVKYSNGKNKILIQEKMDDGDFVTISIKDNGIGMTQEQITRIFDDFYKADSSRHDFDSSGLGLSISKRIVEKHGGRIWANSEGPGKGSTFFFTLPIVK